MKNNKDNPYCPSFHKTPPKEKMIVGIVVLAAVAFIISLTILFTYQIEKCQRSSWRKYIGRTHQQRILWHIFLNSVYPEQSQPNQSLIYMWNISITIHSLIKVNWVLPQKSQARKENQQLAYNLLNVTVVSAFYNSRFFYGPPSELVLCVWYDFKIMFFPKYCGYFFGILWCFHSVL